MKKLLFLTFVIFASFSSCKKSDGPVIIYEQAQLNGTWENIVKDDDGCANQLIITSNSLSEKSICTGSTYTVDYENYSFDGSKIKAKLFGIDATYTINLLTDTKLVVTLKALGVSQKAEYKKVN